MNATQEHIEAVATRGYTIVENVITETLADALNDDLLRLEATFGVVPTPNTFEGHKTIRIYNLLAYGKIYEDIPVHEKILPIVEGVLDKGCLVSSLSSISILPGEISQPIHADDQLMPLPKPHLPTVCNTMWAITAFTEANGATRLVPGTHLASDHPIYGGDYETVAASMPKGSVLVWNGSLWHGGGTNTASGRRVGIAMNYCAGWIRQQENQQLGIPAATAAGFSQRLRELVGYSVYNGIMGHINKRNPVEILDAISGTSPESENRGPATVWDVM